MSSSRTVLEMVAKEFELPVAVLFGDHSPEEPKRGARVTKTESKARHAAMWLLRFVWRPERSFPEIGREMFLDHSTVIHGVRRISHEINEGTELGERVVGLAIRLEELDAKRFLVPDLNVELIRASGDSYVRKNRQRKERGARCG